MGIKADQIKMVQSPAAILRNELAWFGKPIDDMTDEEITAAAQKTADIFALMGLTIEEAGKALRSVFGE